jgi:hypothetical protein
MQEGGKKGIEKSKNSLTRNGIKESDEATYEHIDRCVENKLSKDGVNMFDKFLSNYKVLHQMRQNLSGNITWGKAEKEYERDRGKSRGTETLQTQSTDRVNIPCGNLYEM